MPRIFGPSGRGGVSNRNPSCAATSGENNVLVLNCEAKGREDTEMHVQPGDLTNSWGGAVTLAFTYRRAYDEPLQRTPSSLNSAPDAGKDQRNESH